LNKTELKFNYEARNDENREVNQKPSASLLLFYGLFLFYFVCVGKVRYVVI
jgi:hypothetical protein